MIKTSDILKTVLWILGTFFFHQ